MATPKRAVTPRTDADTLVISRVFHAPRDRLFEMWTRREHVDRWLAPQGFTILRDEAQLRPGGRWRSAMRSPEGKEFRVGGVYREIVEPRLLVFTHAWEDAPGQRGHETLVTVTLEAHGDGRTRMTFTQGPFDSIAERNGHRGGWSECFDRLEAYLPQVFPRGTQEVSMARYVDGFVVPVPKKNLAAYRRMAQKAGKIWREHGALEYVECVADDVKPGKWTSFPQSVKLKPDETVVFSYIVFKSRAQRDRINAKVMADPRLKKMMDPKALPFDGKRMFWGGFKPIVAL